MGVFRVWRNAFRLRKRPREKLTLSDFGCLVLLVILYIIQGIPMGLHNAIPVLLNNRVSYTKIAILSLVAFPFSCKLLWAPIMDFYYVKRIGKRKSWIIPVQLLCSLMLFYGSHNKRMDRWLFPDHHHIVPPKIVTSFTREVLVEDDVKIFRVFLYFTLLYFLLATQDIAVDSWALSMLRPALRIHASACNTLGQSLGYSFAYFIIVISSALFHNENNFFKLPEEEGGPAGGTGATQVVTSGISAGGGCNCHEKLGYATGQHIVTISRFMRFFAFVILVTTVVVFLIRESSEDVNPNIIRSNSIDTSEKEKPVLMDDPQDPESGRNFSNFSVWTSYRILRKVLALKPVQSLAFVLLTKYLFFAAENPIDLKMLTYGLSQDLFAFLKSFSILADIVFPFLISYYIAIYGITNTMYYGMILRFVALMMSTGFLMATRSFYRVDRGEPANIIFFVMLFYAVILRKATTLMNTITDAALFCKVSDPSIGATYITLLNTLSNLGSFYPNHVGLIFMDMFTFKRLHIDGIFVECLVCIVCGFVFIRKFKPLMKKLEFYDSLEWKLGRHT